MRGLPRADAFWFMPHRARLTAAFRLALDVIPSGMLLVSRRGEIVLANPHAEEIFGYARHELLGQPLETLLPAGIRDRHVAFRNEFIAAPSVRSMGTGRDLFGLRKDGTEAPQAFALEVDLVPEAGIAPASPPLQGGANLPQLLRDTWREGADLPASLYTGFTNKAWISLRRRPMVSL